MDSSSIEKATKIKARMTKHRLSSQWLMLRLSIEHNIGIDQSTLSQILSGTRCAGDRPRKVLDCAEKVLDRYESFYVRKE